MGEKEYSGGVSGLFNAGYRKIDSFPTNLQKDEVILHELHVKNKIIFLAFYVENGKPKCTKVHSIETK